MANETVGPALSPAEWATIDDATDANGAASADIVGMAWAGRFQAAAAISLHGQPFGFTREDVANLRRMAEKTHGGHGESYAFAELYPWLLPLAARIEALLPPA